LYDYFLCVNMCACCVYFLVNVLTYLSKQANVSLYRQLRRTQPVLMHCQRTITYLPVFVQTSKTRGGATFFVF